MTNIIEELFYKFHDTLKMSIFNKIKTGNHVVDTIINTFIFTIIGYIFNHLNKNKISLYFGIDKENENDIHYIFQKLNTDPKSRYSDLNDLDKDFVSFLDLCLLLLFAI
jgi:hypothetical protein